MHLPCPSLHGLKIIWYMYIPACRHPGRQKVVEGLMKKAPFARFYLQNICHVVPSPAWHRAVVVLAIGHSPLPWLLCRGEDKQEWNVDLKIMNFVSLYIYFCRWNSEFSLFPCSSSGRYRRGHRVPSLLPRALRTSRAPGAHAPRWHLVISGSFKQINTRTWGFT